MESGRVAAPRSRLPARYTVAATTTATRARVGSNATGSGWVRGRDSSIQPRGVSQTSQCSPGSESATMRRA